MNFRLSGRSLAALSAAAGMVALASQAQAHAHLVSATPAPNSTVAAPSQVTLHFSEKVAPKFTDFDVMKADGGMVTVTTSVPPQDGTIVVGVVSSHLSPGSYMVMWHAVATDDGHRTKGDFSFTVR